jgi:GT2 family glycosyltransferase
MRAEKAPVYVIVLNYNGWSDTTECVESVLRSDYPNTRVIVVDNGSTDGSMEHLLAWASGARPFERRPSQQLAALSWPPLPKPLPFSVIAAGTSPVREGDFGRLTFVTSPRNAGFGGGNNHALRLLLAANAGGYVFLLNNDIVVSPHAVSALVRRIDQDAGLAAVGGLMFDYRQPDMVQSVGGGQVTRLGMTRAVGGITRDEVRMPERLDYVNGGCLLARLETLRHVGLYDEDYFLYGEDGDWGARMRRQGYGLGCTLDAEVWHKGSATTGARSPFQDYHMVRGVLLFVRKHAPRLAIPAFAYSIVRSLAPKIVRGQWARARSVLKAYADHVRH